MFKEILKSNVVLKARRSAMTCRTFKHADLPPSPLRLGLLGCGGFGAVELVEETKNGNMPLGARYGMDGEVMTSGLQTLF